MKNTLYNALVFNASWLVCVLGGSMVALPVAVIVIAIHLRFFASCTKEIALIVVMVLLGVVIDSAFIRSGLLIAPDGGLWPPIWLICLWGLFATTINHSLKWFHNRLGLAAVVGGVAGAMTYLAGTRLTEFALRDPHLLSLAVMFIVWCGVFPLCLLIGRNFLAHIEQPR